MSISAIIFMHTLNVRTSIILSCFMPCAIIFPKSSDPFYIVTQGIKCVTTSWTYSTVNLCIPCFTLLISLSLCVCLYLLLFLGISFFLISSSLSLCILILSLSPAYPGLLREELDVEHPGHGTQTCNCLTLIGLG